MKAPGPALWSAALLLALAIHPDRIAADDPQGAGGGARPDRRAAGDPIDRIFHPEPKYRAELVAAQRRIVDAYGGPNGLYNAIAAGYFVPPHLGAVITGAGVALANWLDLVAFEETGQPANGLDLNSPFFLLFAPTGPPAQVPGGGEGSFDDIWPDPPYELIGWLYGAEYDPANRPHIDGIPDAAWFVHEAGWHMSDGSQILTPPAEPCPGQVAQGPASPPGPAFVNEHGQFVFALEGHGRAWDVHLWRNPDPDEVPVITVNEPFHQLPEGTLDLPAGAFFFPAVGVRPGARGSDRRACR